MKFGIRILLAAVLFLCGCQKDAVVSGIETGALAFNLSMEGVPVAKTRAAGTDTDLNARGFYLAGYHTEGGMETAAADAYPNVFDHDAKDNQAPVPLVTMVNNKFTLQTIKWALDEATCLSFFGWSQNKAFQPEGGGNSATATGIIGQTTNSADKGYPWIDIRNADAPADQTDVVGSRSIDHRNDAVLSAVDLNFRHLLSKMTFKARSSSGANIVFTAVNLKYATNKVYKKARYTFDSNVTAMGAYGAYAEYHAGTAALTTTPPTMNNGAEVALGCGLLIPQTLASGDVSLEIKYRLSPNGGGLPGVEQTKTLPLSAFTFVQGKNYVYTIDVQASDIVVMPNPVVEPWVISGTSLPLISGPKGDLALLLDGYDKPYQHIDGKWYWLDRSGYNRHVELQGYYNGMYDGANHTYVFKQGVQGRITSSLGSPTKMTIDWVYRRSTNGESLVFKFGNSASGGASRPLWTQIGWAGSPAIDVDAGNDGGAGRLSYSVSNVSEFDTRTYWTTTVKPADRYVNIFRNASLVAERKDISAYSFGELDNCYIGTNSNASNVIELSYVKVTNAERSSIEIVDNYGVCQKRFNLPQNPLAPADTDYVLINGLAWTKGNLIATSNNGCKVGAPSDYGLYFMFGSLVGWTGGADGSGVGVGTPALDKRVWPKEMGTTKPTFGFSVPQGDNISTLSDYFFNYSMAPWAAENPTSDIGTFAVPMSGDVGMGDLRNGRYAKQGIGDPCSYYLGLPWRLPIQTEMLALKNSGYGDWVQNGGTNGRWFGQNPGNVTTSIYLPAGGHRYSSSGTVWNPENEARYGTSSVTASGTRFYMFSGSSGVISPDKAYRSAGLPIRCVRNL